MSIEEIYNLIQFQQFPERLIKHHQLVSETAEEIVSGLKTKFPSF